MKFLQSLENRLVCVLLIVVAVIQMYNSQFDTLTPWKGGGFGMFSTNKKANITAVGYKANGDSILINVVANKFDLPISKNFLKSTLNYPKERKLERLGKLIATSYLQPDTIKETPKNLDKRTYEQLKKNPEFYHTIYTPRHYQNEKMAIAGNATKIERVKIKLYNTDFYEEGLLYKKSYLKEIEVTN